MAINFNVIMQKAVTALTREVAASLFLDDKTPTIPFVFKQMVRKFANESYVQGILIRSKPIILGFSEISTIENMSNKPDIINRMWNSQKIKNKDAFGNMGLPVVLFNRASNKRWLVSGSEIYAKEIGMKRQRQIKVLQIECQ